MMLGRAGETKSTQDTWRDRRHRQRIDRAAKRAERERITHLRERIEWTMRREALKEATE